MSRPSLRGRLKAIAVGLVRLKNSPSTRKDLIVQPYLMRYVPHASLSVSLQGLGEILDCVLLPKGVQPLAIKDISP